MNYHTTKISIFLSISNFKKNYAKVSVEKVVCVYLMHLLCLMEKNTASHGEYNMHT